MIKAVGKVKDHMIFIEVTMLIGNAQQLKIIIGST